MDINRQVFTWSGWGIPEVNNTVTTKTLYISDYLSFTVWDECSVKDILIKKGPRIAYIDILLIVEKFMLEVWKFNI